MDSIVWNSYVDTVVVPLCRQDARTWQHSAYGVLTELGELVDLEKRRIFYLKAQEKLDYVLELGDIFWYLGLGCYLLHMETGNLIYTDAPRIRPVFMSWDLAFAQLADCARALLGYQGRGTGDPTAVLVAGLDAVIGLIGLVDPDLTPEQVLEANARKLRKRYPELTWTQDRALNRDLDAENKAGAGC